VPLDGETAAAVLASSVAETLSVGQHLALFAAFAG
jgi:hypothetical protein